MANRVCLGLRSSDYGLFVSQSGVNVLTATEAQLMFSSNIPSFQLVQSGTVTASGSGTNVTIPDQGFYPLVLFFPRITDTTPNDSALTWASIGMVYNSHTSITLYREGNVSMASTLTYGVTRTAVPNV